MAKEGAPTHTGREANRGPHGVGFLIPLQFKQGFVPASHMWPGKTQPGQGVPMSWLDSVCIWAWLGGPDLGDCHLGPKTCPGAVGRKCPQLRQCREAGTGGPCRLEKGTEEKKLLVWADTVS